MASNIIMPKQGLQMTEGTIIKWLKAEGDAVKEGEPLFEIETDKLTITIDSTATGTLLKILRAPGEVVPITEVVAVVGAPGEKIDLPVQSVALPVTAVAEPAPESSVSAEDLGVQTIIMPKQGLQMTEGTIIKWLKAEGDAVKEGEPLFEIETDKLTITIDSTATGTLLKITRGAGEVVPITEMIGIVGPSGTDITPLLVNAAPAVPAVHAAVDAPVPTTIAQTSAAAAVRRAPGERVFATPRAKLRAQEKGVDIAAVSGSGPDGLVIEKDVLNTTAVKATPVARVLAKQGGVDLAQVQGTGVGGKIMKADIQGLLSRPSILGTPAGHTETLVPMAGMRKAIANNMMASLSGMAQANHRMKVDMREAVRLRTTLKEADIKVSYTDILVKAVSLALLEFPMLNSTLRDKDIVLRNYVNMGIAVALDNGLIVPNIKDAQAKTVVEINAEIADLAQKAREGRLSRDEYSGGTFTISNLGMYDIDEFTAVINPPEAAILAVGKIADTPVAVNGTIEIRPIMTLSLTYDHRIVDGAPAAQFLQHIKKLLQNPVLMMLDNI